MNEQSPSDSTVDGANADPAEPEPPGSGFVAGDDTSPLQNLGDWLRGLLGGRNGGASARAAIEELIEDNAEVAAALAPDQRTLIFNILKLHEMTAEDVMIPRAEISAAPMDSDLDELVALMASEAHSRMPVYDGQLDNVIGFVHIKDVLAATRGTAQVAVRDLVRENLFAAPSIKVLDLLLEMRASRVHIAIVVDEYGGVDGLVTIEDLVEEIVGEIEDEHDEDERPAIVTQPDGSVLVDARARIEDLEAAIGPFATSEEHDEIDTAGGVVFALIDRVPRRNEVIAHPAGVEFVVVDVDPRRIKRLKVRRLAPPAAAAAD